ncbi:hypothetical protein QBC38DRAFT_484011 [Podospora fimiseda]|uniref:Transmembrane protein n=1 Tax=Podospora fimiseda TaxID=252190 RepID=A0AAN7BKN4_9PEZI|nr:hypothetical protein QBC38DRAFT_484011 [Podospora fimiseda]
MGVCLFFSCCLSCMYIYLLLPSIIIYDLERPILASVVVLGFWRVFKGGKLRVKRRQR